MTIGLVSLGCAKNAVDLQVMSGHLLKAGHTLAPDPDNADVILVNTCAFIESAREEAAAEIARACELKRAGRCKAVVAAGCFVQRYRAEVLKAFPDLDAVLGLAFENLVVNHYREILPRLGLSRALIESAAPFVKRGSAKEKTGGCQVDLLIQTAQSCCLVEVKRRKEIGEEVLEEVKEKLESLSLSKGISVRTALVYDGRLSATIEASGYFNARNTDQMEMD